MTTRDVAIAPAQRIVSGLICARCANVPTPGFPRRHPALLSVILINDWKRHYE